MFAFGFGLTYADNGDLAALPEASGVTGNEGATGVFFARAATQALAWRCGSRMLLARA